VKYYATYEFPRQLALHPVFADSEELLLVDRV
jgi:hypothetical protein